MTENITYPHTRVVTIYFQVRRIQLANQEKMHSVKRKLFVLPES